MFVKISNLINYFITIFLISIIKKRNSKNNGNEKRLLLIRLDTIGDYILFRNFIEEIKKDEKYKNFKITLAGNIIWKNLAETFDKNFVEEFIWINRKKFYFNLKYKYRILKQIYFKGFEIVIDSTYSREILYGDIIAKASDAKIKIGSEGALEKHAKWKRNFFSDKFYTELIPQPKENLFEFTRNKIFFENLLNKKISFQKPYINTENIALNEDFKNKFIVIFSGASHQKRKWKIENFVEVAKFVINKYNFDVVIAGAKNEVEIDLSNLDEKIKNKIHNYLGKTSLSELAKLIEQSELLISNETGAVHIAAAVNKEFICISNGNHFGRFNPYPKEIFDKANYVYPPEIMQKINDINYLKEKYRFNSDIDINQIKPSEVTEIVKKIFPEN